MIDKVIDVFRDKEPRLKLKQFEKNYFSKTYSKISGILSDSVNDGSLSYSLSMWMLKTTLDELLIVKEHLYIHLPMYNDIDEFHDMLEDLISTINSYQRSIRHLEADYSFTQIDLTLSRKKSTNKSKNKRIELNRISPTAIITFITDLGEKNLIENRDANEIMRQHFLLNLNENEIKPIVWKESKALLAYLINQLYSKKILLAENYWTDTAVHFSWDGKEPKDLRQSHYSSPNPRKSRVVDSIIEKL